MRKLLYFLLPLWLMLLCFPLLGAAPLSEDIYVNDYASLVTKAQRAFMMEASGALEDMTGIQVIVLTVKSLNGMTAEDYAREASMEWQSGNAAVSGDAVILFLAAEDKRFYSLPAGRAHEAVHQVSIALEQSDLSTQLYEAYKSAMRALFAFNGADPGENLAAGLEPGVGPPSNGMPTGPLVAIAIAIFLTLSSFRTNRNNQRRYGKYKLHEHRQRDNKYRDFDEDDSKDLMGYDE